MSWFRHAVADGDKMKMPTFKKTKQLWHSKETSFVSNLWVCVWSSWQNETQRQFRVSLQGFSYLWIDFVSENKVVLTTECSSFTNYEEGHEPVPTWSLILVPCLFGPFWQYNWTAITLITKSKKGQRLQQQRKKPWCSFAICTSLQTSLPHTEAESRLCHFTGRLYW